MKLNFKINFKKPKRPKDISHFSYNTVKPERDWHIVLITFLILSVLGAGIGAYVFFTTIHHETPIVANEQSSEPDLGGSRLHNVVLQYSQKEEDYESAKISVYNVGDPSL